MRERISLSFSASASLTGLMARRNLGSGYLMKSKRYSQPLPLRVLPRRTSLSLTVAPMSPASISLTSLRIWPSTAKSCAMRSFDPRSALDALLRPTVGVGEIIAHLDFARNDLEVRHLPDVRLDGGLEEEEAGRARGIGRDFDTFRGDGARHFVGTGDDVAEELQCAAHAHVLPCANAENGEHTAADEACADACAHVFLGEGALFEELLHQRVVMLGGGFDERLVELGGLVQLLGGDVEHVWFAALRLPAIHFRSFRGADGRCCRSRPCRCPAG